LFQRVQPGGDSQIKQARKRDFPGLKKGIKPMKEFGKMNSFGKK